MSKQNHKWVPIEVPDKFVMTFKKASRCVRGDCGCEKFIDYNNHPLYERNKQIFNLAPECTGDVPINQQKGIE